jgi:hypothetical protein
LLPDADNSTPSPAVHAFSAFCIRVVSNADCDDGTPPLIDNTAVSLVQTVGKLGSVTVRVSCAHTTAAASKTANVPTNRVLLRFILNSQASSNPYRHKATAP